MCEFLTFAAFSYLRWAVSAAEFEVKGNKLLSFDRPHSGLTKIGITFYPANISVTMSW